MKNSQKDEIIQELWKIKDEFSFSCNGDIKKIVERMNKIAEEQGFSNDETTKEDDSNCLTTNITLLRNF